MLHINDTHSHLAAWGPKDPNLDGTLGGLPKAAAIVADEKARDAHALFVHAGDFMTGDLFFNEHLGVPELRLLHSIGLDAMVLGNRDFQFGPALLESVVASAWADGGVPILGTNLDLSNTPAADYPALNRWITGTLIKDVNGVKVGFFGLTIPDGPLANPSSIKIAEYLDGLAPAAVASLRSEGAQVVICLAHLGLALSTQLGERVTGIDVIVDAHDHLALAQPVAVGTTLIVSAGEYYRWVGRLRLSVDGNTVSFVDYTLLSADADTIPCRSSRMPLMRSNPRSLPASATSTTPRAVGRPSTSPTRGTRTRPSATRRWVICSPTRTALGERRTWRWKRLASWPIRSLSAPSSVRTCSGR